MEERGDTEKALDEVMLPGFRFHPTDEELVGFYLKRKIQQRPLSIELIKQLDIYKYDPWDLPRLASTGEKEWYFYCPRDRKYRNSARPNRVTGAGFWKATGTDRPIYSSEGTKCIGLKKSLVFYKGRAAKGIKTDWMMHEFRLPSLTDHSAPPTKRLDKSFPPNDSWAICRIFKKTNSTAQRALSHSWVCPFSPEPNTSHHDHHIMLANQRTNNSQFSSETISNNNISLMSTTKRTGSSPIQLCSANNNENIQNSSSQNSAGTFSPVDFVPYKPYQSLNSSVDFCPSLPFPPLESCTSEPAGPTKTTVLLENITPSMLLNMPSNIPGDSHFGSIKGMDLIGGITSHDEQYYHDHRLFQGTYSSLGISINSLFDHRNNSMIKKNPSSVNESTTSDDQSSGQADQWETVRSSLGFPCGTTLPLPSLPLSTAVVDPWKPSLLWDTSQCPTEVSTNFPTTRCYT